MQINVTNIGNNIFYFEIKLRIYLRLSSGLYQLYKIFRWLQNSPAQSNSPLAFNRTVYLDANLTPKDLGRMSSRSCKLNLSQLISWDSSRPPFKTTLEIKSVNVVSQVFDIIIIKGKINIWGCIEVNWMRKSDFDEITTEIIFLNGQLCISHLFNLKNYFSLINFLPWDFFRSSKTQKILKV